MSSVARAHPEQRHAADAAVLLDRLRSLDVTDAGFGDTDLDAVQETLSRLAPDGSPLSAEVVDQVLELDTHTQPVLRSALHTAISGTDRAEIAALAGRVRAHHARLAAVYAAAVRDAAAPGHGRGDGVRLAWLAARALWCGCEQVKWTGFDHAVPGPALWQSMHDAHELIEQQGLADVAVVVYRGAVAVDAACTDLYAHALLLGTLNSGALSARQFELAHRWLVRHARGMRIEPVQGEVPPDALLVASGAEGARRPPGGEPAGAGARMLRVGALADALADSRRALRSGHLDFAIEDDHGPLSDHAAVLDFAERTWPVDARQQQPQRAPRSAADGDAIEVVTGLERVAVTIAPGGVPATARMDCWTLRDRSPTGIGVRMPAAAAADLVLGTLVGFREPGAADWQVGTVVRRIASDAAGVSTVGVRRLAVEPGVVRLAPRGMLATRSGLPADGVPVVFTPFAPDLRAVDALIVPPTAYHPDAVWAVSTRAATFRVRMNRLIERGAGWIRVGISVLGRE